LQAQSFEVFSIRQSQTTQRKQRYNLVLQQAAAKMIPYGLQAMLKEGHKHYAGVDEAVVRNIEACKNLSQITRTSLGPNGETKAGCWICC
jgi:hypothetical protein